jgi:multiple sugar transport system permease protein
MPTRHRTWGERIDRQLSVLLLVPAGLLLAVTFVYPIAQTGWMSLHDWGVGGATGFAGLANFTKALADANVQASFLRTAFFVLVTLTIQLVVGMALALAVSRMRRGRGIVTALLVLPMMVTPVVVGLIWRFIFDYNFGILNQALVALGTERIAFLSEPAWAMPAVILVEVWQWTPFMFLLLLAGITTLPAEPFEAATMDGANARQQFFLIALPLLRPVIISALVLRFAGLAKEFDKIYVLTGGGPGSATEIASLLIQRAAFSEFSFGYASAIALVLALLVAIICWFAVRAMYSRKDGA